MDHGTGQSQRLLPALLPGYILPDELGLAQRLRSTLTFGSALGIPDEQGQIVGRWSETLRRDESILLSDITAFPLDRIRRVFRRKAENISTEALMRDVWILARRLDQWLQGLHAAEGPGAQALGSILQQEIQGRLAPPLRSCLAAFGAKVPLGEIHAMSSPWGLATWQPDPANPAPQDQRTLLTACLGCLDLMGLLQGRAQEGLGASLNTGLHDPAMGLLLAFMQLYDYTRGPLNRFPERLVDHYYLRMLGMKPREGSTEKVHLILHAEPSFKAPIQIKEGTVFTGGRDEKGAPHAFTVTRPLRLSTARVACLRTLRSERDPLISPERELGYVSRTKAREIPLSEPEAAYLPVPTWWPIFGDEPQSFRGGAADARQGFAIASPVFEVAEGQRELRIALQLSHPADRDLRLQDLLKNRRSGPAWLSSVFERYLASDVAEERPRPWPGGTPTQILPLPLAEAALARSSQSGSSEYLRYRIARCLAEDQAGAFSEQLGLLFAAWLSSPAEDLGPEDLRALRGHGRRCLRLSGPVDLDDPLYLLTGQRKPDRSLIFDRVFRRLWGVRFSGPTGWINAPEAFSRVLASEGRCGRLEILLSLGPEQPAVVPCSPGLHGEEWPSEATLQFELQTQTRLYGYSLLRALRWREAELGVRVQGLRSLQLHNQAGRLDPSKPFQPFGPLPECGAYLTLGSEEMAAKPLSRASLQVEWGGLPRCPGGFREHYQGYPGRWQNDDFRVNVGILRDGQWQQGQAEPLSLFGKIPDPRRVRRESTLELDPNDLQRFHRPSEEAGLPEYNLRARNGFFRLTLTHPEVGFGHSLYPRILTGILIQNARSRHPQALPQEPYTPRIDKLIINYEAIHLLKTGQTQTGRHRLILLHPFGQEMVLPEGHPHLVPTSSHEGSLLIGLEGGELGGELSLFFHLRKEAASEAHLGRRPPFHWSVWTRQGWRGLEPRRVLRDGTQGLLRSGAIILDLPGDLDRDCPTQGKGCAWLRLESDGAFASCAGLYGVHVNGLMAIRVPGEGVPASPLPLPPGTLNTPRVAIPGLRKVVQVGASLDQDHEEGPQEIRARTMERLRHRERACTPWDYERILLNHFPEVARVKAFPHLALPGEGVVESCPGQVLLVVLPYPRRDDRFDSSEAPRLDTGTLAQMTRFLAERSSPGVRLAVRNASYEWIQVRCSIHLSEGAPPGASLNQINQAIVRFLSPWHEEGCVASFDWEIRVEDLETHLRGLSCVDAVGGTSLLHIVAGQGHGYAIRDSADKPDAAWRTCVRAAQPWSLAMPTRQHLIELSTEDPGTHSPVSTGINRLEVGNTFIISKAAP